MTTHTSGCSDHA